MSDSDCSHCDCSSAAGAPAAAPPSPAGAVAVAGSAQYRIDNMDCPTEEALIRAKLATVAGVSGLDFNLMQRTLTVKHSLDSLHTVEAALDAIDMRAQRLDTLAAPTDAAPPAKAPWWPMALAGVCALASETAHWIIGDDHWLVVALALAAIAGAGLSTYKKGWIALKNRELNMNALMSVAVTGAVLIGHWPEAAMVMFLFALAELIEARSLDRARDAIRSLLDLAPQTATVQQPDGAWLETPASAVAVGAVVRLRPGERIALDGVVSSGRSSVNQAPITGESLPVDKAEGDSVFAGTINQSGSFEFRVTAEAGNSALARIVQAVESAQGSRAPTQRFVDSFARVYTPSVVVGALLLALLPPLLFGGEWLDWAYRALVVLVIACPCALVISTPVTIVSGLAAAARKGILVKGGVYLEEGRKLRVLALDKTGTITYGKPAQTDFVVLGGDAGQIRSYAASLAARSDHPVSLAIAQAALADGVAAQPVDEFAAIAGRGVRGSIAGRLYQLGNHRLIEELGLCSPAIEAQLFALERQGKTAVMLADEGGVLAIFAVADTVRETSRQAIADLHTLGVRTLMLSGDNTQTAEAIAKLVGIDEASGNLLPEDKLAKIGALQADAGGGLVGMVGDGINDAPALARAHIGFAMGAVGADSAIETADVALMDDDLRKIPAFIRLSRATARVLTQNIALALGIKAVFLVLTFTGQATMWMAVFADMGASLLVVANGLRLLRR
ncbi:heavy metal translocating P-type ATPase [Rugamonas rubra]|uniref:P-type Zn(2+) transporter n=1 Tax=Rugamonas rubra TaxID=758825 RepID=A0A1I4SVU9_9BURK|nr:heavy metal translocating P-type ATPase [Rugamonas rubra]SFM68470.1 Cd2+/Zn2+-exporting ATPase [Rugamonas rubra]